MPTHTVYKAHERPDCEVLLGGRWVWGQIRMWTHHDDDTWSANVLYQAEPGENRLDPFPAEQLRPVDDCGKPPTPVGGDVHTDLDLAP